MQNGQPGEPSEDREKFLTDNRFPVTPENMTDHRLSAGHQVVISGQFIDYDQWERDGRPDTYPAPEPTEEPEFPEIPVPEQQNFDEEEA